MKVKGTPYQFCLCQGLNVSGDRNCKLKKLFNTVEKIVPMNYRNTAKTTSLKDLFLNLDSCTAYIQYNLNLRSNISFDQTELFFIWKSDTRHKCKPIVGNNFSFLGTFEQLSQINNLQFDCTRISIRYYLVR